MLQPHIEHALGIRVRDEHCGPWDTHGSQSVRPGERVMSGGFTPNSNHIMDNLDNVGKLFTFPPYTQYPGVPWSWLLGQLLWEILLEGLLNPQEFEICCGGGIYTTEIRKAIHQGFLPTNPPGAVWKPPLQPRHPSLLFYLHHSPDGGNSLVQKGENKLLKISCYRPCTSSLASKNRAFLGWSPPRK